MKIAIASSGLGHIQRGIETWAADLSTALHRANQDVTLFQGAGEPKETWRETIACKPRFDKETQLWVQRLRKVGGWRFGFGSDYQMEQTTFTYNLWKRIGCEYDILHVQDPWIALLMEKLHRAGLSRPKVILAHGTEEPTSTLQQFSILQHLAPNYLEDWKQHQPAHQKAYAIPNFVDVQKFAPGEKSQRRKEWGLPEKALIVLCVAAIKNHHKRMDALLREFATFAERRQDMMLVIAGSREAETESVMKLGQNLLGAKVRFLIGVERENIPSLYQTADVFALASLHEMMPIAVLEALSSGLPIVCNNTPTLRWMVGSAGCLNDISQPGAMAQQLSRLADPLLREELSLLARTHAITHYSETVVLNQITRMYEDVFRQD